MPKIFVNGNFIEMEENVSGAFQDFLLISEFRGKYPEVKIFEDVNVKELTANEKSPVFVTLPIGKANVTSGNQRFYDDAFLREMEKQVQELKPIGLMGHLSTVERATAFPSEAVHWVGTLRVSEILWGKGYVPAGEARDRLQRYKATNKKIATSIDARADGVWDASINAYRMIAETLKLGQIDIAPADRAGISDLAAVPFITTEMMNTNSNSVITVLPTEREIRMEKEEVIRDLTVADVGLLPNSVKEALRAEVLSSLRQTMGLAEGDDLPATFAEMRTKRDEHLTTLIRNHVTELVADPVKGIKVPSVQTIVQEMVMARNPKTLEESDTIYAEVSESESIKETLSKIVQETMGPPQKTPTTNQEQKKPGKFFVIPVLE